MQSASRRASAGGGGMVGLIISVISALAPPPIAQHLEQPGRSSLIGGACRPLPLPTASSHPSPPPAPPPGNCSLCAPFCQGCKIGQISVMLKNWPISWQGTLIGGESGVHCCHRCAGRGLHGSPRGNQQCPGVGWGATVHLMFWWGLSWLNLK